MTATHNNTVTPPVAMITNPPTVAIPNPALNLLSTS
jgi:hypothetical protein